MSIIEQLGGYEKAKEHYDKHHSSPLGHNYLGRQLLEYRRANNIFEVGDRVVCWVTGRVGLIDCFIGDYFCMVKIKNDVGGFTFIKNNMEAIKHATDAERQAGKRLPQLEVLNDIDIPPNTIILGDK